MPTYEFRCPDGHDFEKFYRSIGGAESAAACPSCGKTAERVMSAAGFAFKGSGFYLTDYGKNAHRGEAPSSGKPAGDGAAAAAPADGKGESKSEPKSETKSDTSSSPAPSASGDSKKAEPKPAAPKADAPAKKSSSE